ncbi:hypothetical protein LAJ19_14880 (plasmid) [Deinococcus taeanensis]|uniref:hypothetical protein n=1 Tax=Deinococcus taeanensis TaxID=2737050 RepID=UPI001CDBBC2E|nr:hypothetical protein [Deinococcus taeanensis]UBV44093.1 hypothetical protein LAJ19_14880 [Deinococcus taeanensis]
MCLSLAALSVLCRYRPHGTFTVTCATTASQVAVQAGAATGGTRASHPAACSGAD